MATVSFNGDKSVLITLRKGVKLFTYSLSVGTEFKNLQYESNGGIITIKAGSVTALDPTNETLSAGSYTINANMISSIEMQPSSIMSVNTDDLDIADSDKFMDATGEMVAVGKVKTNIVIGADSVIEDGEYGPDPVIDEDDYVPIEPNKKPGIIHDLIYDQRIQKISYIQANMAAVFREWFTGFFPPDYFRHIRMKSESTFTAFKSFMKDIYHKEPPVLVIDPNTIEHVDDFLFGTNVVNRYNLVDPKSDNVGAKILYSLAMIETEKIKLHYRRNRYRFRFDVMIMERSLNRSLDLYNYLIMNMRHNSKFMLFRRVPNLLPSHMIRSIAKINGFNSPDQKFLEWINARAIGCTITTRTLPSGQVMFFAEQDCHIQVEVPDMPAHDSPEQAEAIEVGARVTDSFIFTVDLPSEYFCTMEHEVTKDYIRYEEGDDPDIHYITKSDDYKWEEGMDLEIGDYTLLNRVDVTIQDDQDNALDLLTVLNDVDAQMRKTAEALLRDSNVTLPEPLFLVKIIKGTKEFTDFNLSDDGILTINFPDYSKIYHIYVYVNQKYINMYSSALNSEWIGDIQKTDY